MDTSEVIAHSVRASVLLSAGTVEKGFHTSGTGFHYSFLDPRGPIQSTGACPRGGACLHLQGVFTSEVFVHPRGDWTQDRFLFLYTAEVAELRESVCKLHRRIYTSALSRHTKSDFTRQSALTS